MQIKRIKMDVPGRGDAAWLLYEDGKITHPIRVLSDYEAAALAEQIEEQQPKQRAREALQIDGTIAELQRIGDSHGDERVWKACFAARDLLLAGASGTPLFTTKKETA